MDVQQKLVLEVAFKALENAGLSITAMSGTDTAVFIGKLDRLLTLASRALIVYSSLKAGEICVIVRKMTPKSHNFEKRSLGARSRVNYVL